MANLTLGCCIQQYLSKKSYSFTNPNLTEIYALVKPCFPPNDSISDVFMYILSEDIEMIRCPKETTTQGVCDVNINKSAPALAAFWILVMLVAVTGNIIVCLVIYKTRCLRTILTNQFIASLAVSDLMVGIFLVPVKIVSTLRSGRFCVSSAVCHYYVTMDNISFVASITNLLVITGDRFIAIDWPYTYQDKVTKKRAKLAIVGVWIYAITMGALTNVKWSSTAANQGGTDVCWSKNKVYVTYVFIAIFYIPALIMGVTQGRMLYIALKHSKEIVSTTRIAINNKEDSDEETASVNQTKQFASRLKKVLREYRAVKVIMVVYGTFLVCWIPVSIMALIHAWCPSCVHFQTWHSAVFAEILPVLNSTLNFFIYSVMNRQFRKACRRLCTKIYFWCTNDFA